MAKKVQKKKSEQKAKAVSRSSYDQTYRIAAIGYGMNGDDSGGMEEGGPYDMRKGVPLSFLFDYIAYEEDAAIHQFDSWEEARQEFYQQTYPDTDCPVSDVAGLQGFVAMGGLFLRMTDDLKAIASKWTECTWFVLVQRSAIYLVVQGHEKK